MNNALVGPNSTRLFVSIPEGFGEEACREADRIAHLLSLWHPTLQWDVMGRDDASHVIVWWDRRPGGFSPLALEPHASVLGWAVRCVFSGDTVAAAPTYLDALRRARTALEERLMPEGAAPPDLLLEREGSV